MVNIPAILEFIVDSNVDLVAHPDAILKVAIQNNVHLIGTSPPHNLSYKIDASRDAAYKFGEKTEFRPLGTLITLMDGSTPLYFGIVESPDRWPSGLSEMVSSMEAYSAAKEQRKS